MKFKWITAGMLAVMMSVGMFSTTAAAFVDETAVEDTPSQQNEQLEESADEPMQPLTPDGNLTLVDDEGDVPKSRQAVYNRCDQDRKLFLFDYRP